MWELQSTWSDKGLRGERYCRRGDHSGVYEITNRHERNCSIARWFSRRFRGKCEAPRVWRTAMKGVRCCGAIVPLSVVARWYSSVVVQMLHNTREPKGWERLHVRAPPSITNKCVAEAWLMSRKTKEIGMHGSHTYKTKHLAIHDVETAFDVKKPVLFRKYWRRRDCIDGLSRRSYWVILNQPQK